ncbi:hypothetical protein DY000_02057602 [Brassica cretica]|uniref:Uncharacterized protein n=1 Tax=Brassica cretica TaxID=69181 RepID=A0ABQ7A4I6_BRACR|nr:hypothetical protein DY000_02057602 [Brassica cretica]
MRRGGRRSNLMNTTTTRTVNPSNHSAFPNEISSSKLEKRWINFVTLVKSDPVIHTLLPLTMKGDSCDVKGEESSATELASRMSAMCNATDNALELERNLTVAYNRERQPRMTGELLESVAGDEGVS